MTNHTTTLMTSITSSSIERNGSTIIRTRLTPEPAAAALCAAVVRDYNRLLDRPRPTTEDLVGLAGQKVTVLRHGATMFGAPAIEASAGRIFVGSNGGPALLPAGKRTSGYRLSGVLDFVLGYNGADVLGQRVTAAASLLPVLTNLTQEDLDSLPDRGQACSLAVFGTWHGPDSVSPGAVWLAHSYMKEDDIVECVLLVRPEDGESEHGSVYGKELLAHGGKISGFPGISFSDALTLAGDDYYTVAPLVFGRV